MGNPPSFETELSAYPTGLRSASPYFSAFTRSTVTECGGKVWRNFCPTPLMVSARGATLVGSLIEFSSVGLPLRTMALAAGCTPLAPYRSICVARASAETVTTLRMMSPVALARLATAYSARDWFRTTSWISLPSR